MLMRPHFITIIALFCSLLVLTSSGGMAQYSAFDDPGARQLSPGGKPSGGLVPVSPQVDGGTIPIGATGQVVVRFRNEGVQPVETGLIRLYPSSTISADISMNQCEEEPLASGAECAIALSVKGLQAGPWRIEMLMSHSGRTRLVTATMSGQVESTGEGADRLTSDLESIPDQVDFGTLNDSQTLVEPVILRNITSTPIEITEIYIDTSDQAGYNLKTQCDTLQAGQACIAVVSWSPLLRGRSSGVLVVKHTGPTGIASIPVGGEYSPEDVNQADVFPQAVPGRGLLVASQTEVDFGGDIETASTITVSLVNAGDAPVKIRNIQISGSDNGLDFKEGGCAAETVLEPIEACPLTLTWSPTRVGALFDDVQVAHNGARGILVLPVRGDAIATVSQDQKSFVISETGQRMHTSSPPQESSSDSQETTAPVRRTPSTYAPNIKNPASVLDGYKITSFSPNRAIINGPGGSRLVFDNEEIVIGGVPWFVLIQQSGIEFLYQGQRVMLLFDRSLSSINRVTASSGRNTGSNNAANSSASSSNTVTTSTADSGDDS